MRVVPYDPAWPEAYERERERLAKLLGPACGLHHAGSTSVPGLAAKPVIDILVEAPSLRHLDGRADAMVRAGYDARGEYGTPGRRYFVRPPGGVSVVHVHAFVAGAPPVRRNLLFRDYLRAHPRAAARYGALKSELAAAHPEDRDAYQTEKAALIEELEEEARAWARTSGRTGAPGFPTPGRPAG